jgi:hypothetical protein
MREEADVRFGSKADICGAPTHVRFTPNSDRESELPQKVMSALPRKRTCAVQLQMSALGWGFLQLFTNIEETSLGRDGNVGLHCRVPYWV